MIVSWLLANRWTWALGAALVAVGFYFAWRSHQRGIGARTVLEKIREETEKARARSEKAAADYRRDGVSRRLRDGDY